MKKRLLSLILLAILPITTAFAVKVSSLYQAELPIASQADDLRSKAAEQGLLQVLIKLTGDREIDTNPTIKANLPKADNYVEEFSYNAATPSSQTYVIKLRYDMESVNQLLKKAGVAYWGANRPLILVWLSIANDQGAAQIIGDETPSDLLSTMKQQGKQYGLPLIFPVMDMEDMSKVTPADVNAMTVPMLRAASKRYAPDAFLVGNIQKVNGAYQSKWQLVMVDNQWDWTINANTPDAVILGVLNQMNQALAKRYVIKTPSSQQIVIQLEVNHVTERNDLLTLMRTLKQLTLVQQVQLSQIAGDVVDLSVTVRGTLADFAQNASIGQHLNLISQDDANNKMVYEWVH